MPSVTVSPSPRLRAVCEEAFHIRARHGWPPDIVAYPHRIETMEQRASEMGPDRQSSDGMIAHVVQYVRDIASVM